jgi:hypothetical protein
MPQFRDAWGFSKLDTYWTCPAKFKYQFIEKIKDEGSPAMERGQKIHEGIEEWLNGWRKDLPAEAALHFQVELEELKTQDFKAEAAWGFNADWTKRPDWFGKDCWLRAKVDAHYITKDRQNLVVIDFKSGKYRVPSTDQVELYAIAGSSVYPEIPNVRAEFWFVDTGETYAKDYTREELLALRKKFEGYVQPIYADQAFSPTPSRECRWCQHSRTRGGKCQY